MCINKWGEGGEGSVTELDPLSFMMAELDWLVELDRTVVRLLKAFVE